MIPEYVVVQAGGRGSRLGYLTDNKPKCLVPVENLPMIFHLFRKYPDSKFIIIGDYHYEVLKRYLTSFADVDYQLVCATEKKGTCAGMREAFSMIPEETPFLVIWSDLIMPKDLELPDEKGNYIGLAKDFPCRWRYESQKFEEKRSSEYGVAGMFVFENAATVRDVPEEGEFVRWLSLLPTTYKTFPIYHMKEYGLLEEYQKIESAKCRPFNRIYIENGRFVKEAIDEQGRVLAIHESNWYRKLEGRQLKNIPAVFGYAPLKMELVDGKSVYEYKDLSLDDKKKILGSIVECLKDVHNLGSIPAEILSYREAYVDKTFKRLEKVYDLVPFAHDSYIHINGHNCRNIFFHREEVEQLLMKFMPREFHLIHGDCTFSNLMLRNSDYSPVLIDPRGYFGFTELYGDVAYDWAKLYYSVVGNYDQFNRKRFRLTIREDSVQLDIASNGWEPLEQELFGLIGDEVDPRQLHILHAIIWLSLTTYAWEDYDSICGAFYNGIYYLEESLHENIF